MTCYIVADSGKVSVAGHDVLEDSFAVRQNVGYLPESSAVYADMRVLDYLNFIGRARQIPAARLKESIDRVVQQVEIERMLKKNVGHLSKGYKQRVGLAQAMIHDPPILILDEPTSGLDPHQIIEIRELLRRLGKHKVILFSSHILQEISAICSRIIIIKDGTLVADGKPQELQARATGQQVFRVSIAGPEDAVKSQLESIPGVESIEVISHQGEFHDMRVRARENCEIGPAVYNAAREADWNLSVLQPELRSLEEVYLKLTATGAAA
jgi:ABC-2 type transport system ATP-binding protein